MAARVEYDLISGSPSLKQAALSSPLSSNSYHSDHFLTSFFQNSDSQTLPTYRGFKITALDQIVTRFLT